MRFLRTWAAIALLTIASLVILALAVGAMGASIGWWVRVLHLSQ